MLHIIGVKIAKLYFMQSNVLLVKERIYTVSFASNVNIGLRNKTLQLNLRRVYETNTEPTTH